MLLCTDTLSPTPVRGLSDAARAGVHGEATGRIDDRHLAEGLHRVLRHEGGERFGRAPPVTEQGEAARSVADLDDGLRRHRADPGLGPRHDAARAEVRRLHADAERAGLRITSHDRIRHVISPGLGGTYMYAPPLGLSHWPV